MGMPQVPEQVRKAPTRALRAVFTGIGKMRMAADRPGSRRGGPKPAAAPEYRLPEPAAQWDTLGPAAPARPEPEPVPPPPAAAAEETQRWRSLDETGNVRLLTSEELTAGTGPAVTPRPGGAAGAHAGRSASLAQPGQGPTSPVPPGPAGRRPVAASSGDGPGGPSGQPLGGNVPVGSDLIIHAVPLPGYDSMPVTSIRARLRTLDFDQLQALLVHERKNAGRPEVIAMIERRIEKLEAGA
jgi:hypothetical protein